MYCKLCGRKLKNRESIETGYGPVCIVKAFGKASYSKEETDDYNIPGQMSIDDFLEKEEE